MTDDIYIQPTQFRVSLMPMSLEEAGAYSLLLEAMGERDGSIADDEAVVCKALGCGRRKWRRYRKALLKAGVIEASNGALTVSARERNRSVRFKAQPRPSGKARKALNVAKRLSVYDRDGYKCVYCGSRSRLTLDHVTPHSAGGSDEVGNLVTACRDCNSRKGAKTLADFWGERQ